MKGLLSFALEGHYKAFYDELKKISAERCRKSAWWMFLDCAAMVPLLGSGLQDYLNFRFYEKSFRERRTYATIGYMDKVNRDFEEVQYSPFIAVKGNFHKNYAKYTHREHFNAVDGSFEQLEAFLLRHEMFVVKPQIGLGGNDVVKMCREEIEDRQDFFESLRARRAIVEELIVQEPHWAALCPNSVNTIRIMTVAIDGRAQVIFACARVGNGSNITDNFSHGGMGVLVDRERGVLVGSGVDKALHESPTSVTGVTFDGFPIPYWKEIQEMVLEAALVDERIHMVGWDVAITPNGPLLIEGNRSPGFDVVQVVLGCGAKSMVENARKELRAYYRRREKLQKKKNALPVGTEK